MCSHPAVVPAKFAHGWKYVSIVLGFRLQLITSACWLGLSLKWVVCMHVCMHGCSFSCMWVSLSLLLLACLRMHSLLEPRNFTKGTVHDNMHSNAFCSSSELITCGIQHMLICKRWMEVIAMPCMVRTQHMWRPILISTGMFRCLGHVRSMVDSRFHNLESRQHLISCIGFRLHKPCRLSRARVGDRKGLLARLH